MPDQRFLITFTASHLFLRIIEVKISRCSPCNHMKHQQVKNEMPRASPNDIDFISLYNYTSARQ
jgi:hypothetical protein